MARLGQKINGRYYLKVQQECVEVSEAVYYEYFRLVWREQKGRQRSARCIIAGKRCYCDCTECEYEMIGVPLSMDQLEEKDDYHLASGDPSVEEQVITHMLYEALHRELAALGEKDRFIIHGLYFRDNPYTQEEIAKRLGITQVAVHKRHRVILTRLRERLEEDMRE